MDEPRLVPRFHEQAGDPRPHRALHPAGAVREDRQAPRGRLEIHEPEALDAAADRFAGEREDVRLLVVAGEALVIRFPAESNFRGTVLRDVVKLSGVGPVDHRTHDDDAKCLRGLAVDSGEGAQQRSLPLAGVNPPHAEDDEPPARPEGGDARTRERGTGAPAATTVFARKWGSERPTHRAPTRKAP